MMESKKPTIPLFASDQDEREFWTKHSVEEFADQLEELDVKITNSSVAPAPVSRASH